MKIESLKLRGFTGIQKGLGLEEIVLDLSDLSGLIALAGPNGRGKSTVLENLHPFRTLASRAGSLQHHVCLRDALKELVFSWNGDRFETQVKIDSQSGKSEAFIWRNGHPEIRGKVSEYDAYMHDLLGSEALFFSSVFCAQGGQKLSDMTTGQLKGLFSEFLRLDRLIAFESTSRQAAVLLNGKAQAIQQTTAYLLQEVAKRADLERLHGELQEDLEGLQVSKGFLEGDYEKAEAALKAAQGRAKDNEILKVKLEGLYLTDAQTQEELLSVHTRADADTALIVAKLQPLVRQRREAGALIADREKIRAAVAREKEVSAVINVLREKLEALSAATGELATRRNVLQMDLVSLRSEYKALQADPALNGLQAEFKNLEAQVQDLDRRDPECQSTTCSFIVRALSAQERIPGCKAEVAIRSDEIAALQSALNEKGQNMRLQLDKLTAEHEDLEGQKRVCAAERDALSTEHNDLLRLVRHAEEVEVAAARMTELQERIDELLQREEEIKTRADEETTVKSHQLQFVQAEIIATKDTFDRYADEQVRAGEATMARMKAQVADMERQITEKQKQTAGIEAKLQEIEKTEAQIAEQEIRRSSLIAQASEWQYLQAACSKDGLRALEIDSVAPTISAYANELLAGTFGPLFSVRFRTQDDAGREVLDILAIREDGAEALIENLSGGERVWILKALRLAMTLVSKEKSGHRFGTAFADEEDGALDVANGQNFIQMYRAFLASGGFESMFYISHKPESISMADHVLQFGPAGIEVL